LTTEVTAATRGEGLLPPQEERMPGVLLGMILFIASEMMFFGSLFGAYYTLRAQSSEWPPPGTPETDLVLPTILTVVLLLSSVTQHFVMLNARKNNAKRVVWWLTGTIVLGLIFLGGEGTEWITKIFDEGFTIGTNPYATLFFTITGFHGLHLLIGLFILIVAHARARRAATTGEKLGSLEAATYYWHFVDGVWLIVVTSVFYIVA
jgi:cytochrome c oxidase subunit III